MANQTLYRDIAKVVGVSPTFEILSVSAGGGGGVTPDPIFAANASPASFRIVDFVSWNNGALQALATATLQSTIAGGGLTAISDALAIANENVITRAATILESQALITLANNDSLSIAKQANTNRHVSRVLAYLV